MVDDFEARVRAARWMLDVAERAGVKVDKLNLIDISHDLSAQISDRGGYGDKDNERALLAVWDVVPALRLRRSSGLIYLDGTREGLRVEFYFGSGACERVEVGTRWVEAVPAHEEPIYEVRCVDPLREGVAS